MDRGTVEIMTLKLARDLAKRSHAAGYFRPNLHHYDDAYKTCPLCQERVTLIGRPYARRFKAPSTKEWADTLVRHLTDPYDDSRCTAVKAVRSGSEWKW